MQTAQELYNSSSRWRLIRGAVEEAKDYPRALCNQNCKTHLYFKDHIPYEQLTGKKHDCIMTRIAKMFIGHYQMIAINKVKRADMASLPLVLENAEEWCRKWSLAFDDWKKSGKVPSSEEVEGYY